MVTSQVDFGEALSFGWSRFKSNVGFHLIALLVIMFVAGCTFGLLAGPLLIGYGKAIIKAENGQAPEIGELFGSFDKFAASLIPLVMMIVAGVIPVFGGVLAAPLFFAALYLCIEGENDGMNAVKRAWEIYEVQLVPAAIGFFVVSLVGSAGLIACCVGIFVTAPIAMLANFRLSQQMIGRSTNGMPSVSFTTGG
jgi:hypothetical protein